MNTPGAAPGQTSSSSNNYNQLVDLDDLRDPDDPKIGQPWTVQPLVSPSSLDMINYQVVLIPAQADVTLSYVFPDGTQVLVAPLCVLAENGMLTVVPVDGSDAEVPTSTVQNVADTNRPLSPRRATPPPEAIYMEGSLKTLAYFHQKGSSFRIVLDAALYTGGIPRAIADADTTRSPAIEAAYAASLVSHPHHEISSFEGEAEVLALFAQLSSLAKAGTAFTHNQAGDPALESMEIKAMAEHLLIREKQFQTTLANLALRIHYLYVSRPDLYPKYGQASPELRRHMLFCEEARIIAILLKPLVVQVHGTHHISRARHLDLSLRDVFGVPNIVPGIVNYKDHPEKLVEACGIHLKKQLFHIYPCMLIRGLSPYDAARDNDRMHPTPAEADNALQHIVLPTVPAGTPIPSRPGMNAHSTQPAHYTITAFNAHIAGTELFAFCLFFFHPFIQAFFVNMMTAIAIDHPETFLCFYKSQNVDFPTRDLLPLAYAGALADGTTALEVAAHLKTLKFKALYMLESIFGKQRLAVNHKVARSLLLLFSRLPVFLHSYIAWRYYEILTLTMIKRKFFPEIPPPRARISESPENAKVQASLAMIPSVGASSSTRHARRPSQETYAGIYSRDEQVRVQATAHIESMLSLTLTPTS